MNFDPYRKPALFGLFAVSCIVLSLTWRYRGCTQIGNAVSFVGALVSVWPTAARLWLLRRYARSLKPGERQVFAAADAAAERARRRRLLAFDVREVWMFAIGVALLMLGFALTILAADGPWAICGQTRTQSGH